MTTYFDLDPLVAIDRQRVAKRLHFSPIRMGMAIILLFTNPWRSVFLAILYFLYLFQLKASFVAHFLVFSHGTVAG